ncbi:exodeoxyribonuclease V subunit alpha [Aestuariimicrobium sp. Y1814]|uniref:exodeoxyribonuclease V subunit alpha n=1 Tax=Aestuariimicrobium sp. Y1814 TaxID=3418742 RepID=UPI003DA70B3E
MSLDTAHVSVLARGQDTPLARAHLQGLVTAGDVQLASTLLRMFSCTDELVKLTAALCFAGARAGSTCLDLGTVADRFVDNVLQSRDLTGDELRTAREELVAHLDWPEVDQWSRHLAGQPVVGDVGSEPNSVPLRLVDSLVYLERYFAYEESVADLLQQRQQLSPPVVDPDLLARSLAREVPGGIVDALQQQAVEAAVTAWTTVLAGGPGTGKTTTVARVLAAVQEQSATPIRVALAAPSGKAASRLHQAVSAQVQPLRDAGALMPAFGSGLTLHRLLDARGLTGDFRHGPTNPVPYDLVVVDEVSMVDLKMFAVLLSAVGPTTRLLLVGDPQQLKSVSAGSVLADITASGISLGQGRSESAVTVLQTSYRNRGTIHELAQAIRERDGDAAVATLERGGDSVELLDVEVGRTTSWRDFPELATAIEQQWLGLVEAAEEGDAAEALRLLDQHRVLCGHRRGLFGVSAWTHHTLDVIRRVRPGFGVGAQTYPGRPLLLTTNDATLDLSNGDTGVVVRQAGRLQVALGDQQQHRLLGPALLRGVEDLFAMTVHKAQGSQFDHTTVVLPPLGSPLLTRDLVYTAVTRARERATIIGTPEQLRAAIQTEARRASGLASRWRKH